MINLLAKVTWALLVLLTYLTSSSFAFSASSLPSTTKASRSSLNASGVAITTPRKCLPQFWDFQGHKCYAEVSRPSDNNNPFSIFDKPKPEIILIHGFGCSTVYWRETTTYLTNAGYKVHALDLLGLGKSAKPGRAQGVEYSTSLWAEMVDSYAQKYIQNDGGIILVGNSLGSCVALATATGDFASTSTSSPYIAAKTRGICMFNCGVGMNSRNIIRDPIWNPFQRFLISSLFDTLDFVIFGNEALISYALDKVVTKELLKNALTSLYQCAPDPAGRVDDQLVDSFYLPAKDNGSVEAFNQIYTNDPGKTPMEFHQDNPILSELPIKLIWGDSDAVTPIEGSVGQFYTKLANDKSSVSLKLIKGGHVPFDEIPECNEYLVKWLATVVNSETSPATPRSFFQWPFSQ